MGVLELFQLFCVAGLTKQFIKYRLEVRRLNNL